MIINEKKILNAIKNNDKCIDEISKYMNVSKDKLKSFLIKADHNDTCTLNIDGASRGNPGPGGIGVVFAYGNIKRGYYSFIGNCTNNEAEYTALIKGLNIALENKVGSIKIYTDSELICNQIKGNYKINKENLIKLYNNAIKLIDNFKSFSINYIPREKNKDADKLANIAIDKKKDGEIELAVVPVIK